MRWQTVLKMAGAIVSALFVATDITLNAEGVAPSIPWQYLALGGFIVFAFLMAWMLWDANSQLASHRPKIGLGRLITASTEEIGKEVIIRLRPTFHNEGQNPAYQFCLYSGYAPAEYPEQFKPMPDLTNSSPIYQAPEFGPLLELKEPFVSLKGGGRGVRTKEILMYCGIEYSDASRGGHKYKSEWWFVYPLGYPTLAAASKQQIKSLEPYVRQVFGRRGNCEVGG